jgi:hypothetical protein
MSTSRALRIRIQKLEERARVANPIRRVIWVWVDNEGQWTKAADTNPHLPDERAYYEDMTRPRGSDEAQPTGSEESIVKQ